MRELNFRRQQDSRGWAAKIAPLCVAAAVCGFSMLGAAACAAENPPRKAPPQQQQQTVDPLIAAMLIKSTVIALQHANQTGNYTVLRDMGTPVFRERFDATRLAALFSSLRARGINLSPVLMLQPSLDKPTGFTAQKQLHLIGNFPTQPLEIRFELVFLQIDGVWRVDGLAVDAQAPRAVPGPQAGNVIHGSAGREGKAKF
jgi:hypothetical protein